MRNVRLYMTGQEKKIKEMIRMIRYPPIPLQANHKGKISNQMKNKVKMLKNLYKKTPLEY